MLWQTSLGTDWELKRSRKLMVTEDYFSLVWSNLVELCYDFFVFLFPKHYAE